MSILWLVATSQFAIYASCPSQTIKIIKALTVYLDISQKYCPTMIVTLALGYVTVLLFASQFLVGVRDQRKADQSKTPGITLGSNICIGRHVMFAKASWKN